MSPPAKKYKVVIWMHLVFYNKKYKNSVKETPVTLLLLLKLGLLSFSCIGTLLPSGVSRGENINAPDPHNASIKRFFRLLVIVNL